MANECTWCGCRGDGRLNRKGFHFCCLQCELYNNFVDVWPNHLLKCMDPLTAQMKEKTFEEVVKSAETCSGCTELYEKVIKKAEKWSGRTERTCCTCRKRHPRHTCPLFPTGFAMEAVTHDEVAKRCGGCRGCWCLLQFQPLPVEVPMAIKKE